MVEVRGMGGETAQLRFDEHYLNQLAANAVKKAPPSVAPSQPAPPSAAPARSLNRTSASSIGSPRGAQTGGAGFVPVIPAALQGILPPSAFAAAPAEAAPTSPPSQEGGQTTASPGGFVSPPLHRRRSISAVRF